MNAKHFTSRRPIRFIALAVVTTVFGLALSGLAGAASSSTPPPDLIERWVETHKVQAIANVPDLIERWVQAHPFGLKAAEEFRALPKPMPVYYTPEGLYADGLRLQGIAAVYERLGQQSAAQTSRPKLCPRTRWYGPLCISRGILVPAG